MLIAIERIHAEMGVGTPTIGAAGTVGTAVTVIGTAVIAIVVAAAGTIVIVAAVAGTTVIGRQHETIAGTTTVVTVVDKVRWFTLTLDWALFSHHFLHFV